MILPFLCCLLVTFVFSGIESGVLSINRIRLRQRALDQVAEAVALDALLQHPARLMATVVVMTTLSRILGLSLFFGWLLYFLHPVWAALALLVFLPLFAFLFEFLPKAIFRSFPYRKLLVFARILVWTDRLISPLAWLVTWLGRPFFRIFQHRAEKQLVGISEVRRATNALVEENALTPLQKHFIHSILNARGITAGDLVLPKKELIKASANEKVSELLELARKQEVDRIPVESNKGEIIGVVRVLDLLLDGIASGRAQSYARRIVEIEPETALVESLRIMRGARSSMALVKNSEQPASILLAEDIVRRLFLGSSR